MRPTNLEAERRRLFAQTVRRLEQRLLSASAPHEMIPALRWGMEELDRTFAETPAKVKATAACRSGCAACCSVPVDVQAHEVFFAAEYIQLNFPPVALAGVIARASAHRARASGLGQNERDRLREPCALLQEGACSIYAGRPAACRAHHSSNAALCAAHAADSSVDIASGYIPALRSRMYAVMLGLDEAMEAAGFDERAYDFGSALHEALTNSLCLARWLGRKPAFPDSCLADLPGDGAERGRA